MDTGVLAKAVALADSYVEKIHPGADFGTGAWFYYLNNALSNIQITDSEYDKIISLSRAMTVKYSAFRKPQVEVLDRKLLEETVISAGLAEPADERFLSTVGKIRAKADEYSKAIGTQAVFGTQEWMEDLWRQSLSGKIMEDEYDEISEFAEMNRPLLCGDEEAKDIQWSCLLRWISEMSGRHPEARGVEFTPKTADFFRSFLAEDKDSLSDRDYALVSLAFKDIEAMRRGEFESSYTGEKDSLREFNRISLSLAAVFIATGFILPGLVVCLEYGDFGESFLEFVLRILGGFGVATLFAGFIYMPLVVTGSILIANAIARAVVFKGKKPDENVITAGRRSFAGASIGSARIVGGWLSELCRPGWTKDSGKV